MAVRNLTPPTAACPACGAYGTSDHRPTCKPRRRFKLGRMRGVRRDSRNSSATLTNARIQDALVRRVSAQKQRPR